MTIRNRNTTDESFALMELYEHADEGSRDGAPLRLLGSARLRVRAVEVGRLYYIVNTRAVRENLGLAVSPPGDRAHVYQKRHAL